MQLPLDGGVLGQAVERPRQSVGGLEGQMLHALQGDPVSMKKDALC